MAGGALVVSGGMTAAGASAAAGLGWWSGIPEDAVFADAVKLTVTTEFLVLRQQGDVAKATELAARTTKAIAVLEQETSALEAASSGGEPTEYEDISNSLERKRGYLESLQRSILARISDFQKRVAGLLTRPELLKQIKSTSRALMVSVSITEEVAGKMSRASHIVPALVVNERGDPLFTVVINVLCGRDRTRGREMMEKLGVSSPLAAEIAGRAVEIACNPVVWTAVAGIVAGPEIFQVGGAVAVLLQKMQVDPMMLAQAIDAVARSGLADAVTEVIGAVGNEVKRTLVPQAEPLPLKP
jgi:hypothetical protein